MSQGWMDYLTSDAGAERDLRWRRLVEEDRIGNDGKRFLNLSSSTGGGRMWSFRMKSGCSTLDTRTLVHAIRVGNDGRAPCL